MNKLVFLKFFTCHNVHHPKAHSVVLFTSRKRKDLWRQLHLDMRLMRCWASAQHDIRYSILLFLRQEHLGQQVKISRRRKHSDYFRQVRCSIFDFDLFHSEHLESDSIIIIFGLPLTYAYATLRQSVAGNLTFRGIVFCNLGTPNTVISNIVSTRQMETPYSFPCKYGHPNNVPVGQKTV